MKTSTFAMLAAIEGASLFEAARRRLNRTAPTLAMLAAPRGGLSLLETARRRLM